MSDMDISRLVWHRSL